MAALAKSLRLCRHTCLPDRTARQHDFQSGALWKYAQIVGDAEKGAVTHPGGAAETHCYADI